MAVAVCPSCHERFRYDSREELEVLAGDAAVVPDGGPLTFRSHQRVVHACPSRPLSLATEPATREVRKRAEPVT